MPGPWPETLAKEDDTMSEGEKKGCCEEHSGHEARIARNETDIRKQSNRNWQMLIITVINILSVALILIKGFKP